MVNAAEREACGTRGRAFQNGVIPAQEKFHQDIRERVRQGGARQVRGMPHDEERGCADTCPPPCGRRVGNMFVIAEGPAGTPLIVLGPCWMVGSCTFLLIAGVTTAVLVLQVQPQHSWLLWAVGCTLLFTTSAAFCMTCAGDPGLFEGRATGQPSDWVFSDQAGLYRPPGRNVKWCKEAGTLVEDLDHFCPWTGTVIASKNLCSFQFFLCSLLGLILYVCFVLVMPP